MNRSFLLLASAGLAGLVLGMSSRSFQGEGVRASTQARIAAAPMTDASQGGQITRPEELLGAALGALLGEVDLQGWLAWARHSRSFRRLSCSTVSSVRLWTPGTIAWPGSFRGG